MMQTDIREQILEDVKALPSEKLELLRDYVQQLKEKKENRDQRIVEMMRFAGSWVEMPESEFQSFSEEITQRRQQAFSGRSRDETGVD